MTRESPFIFEDAVPREKFFDRKEELEFFVRNLRAKKKMLLCIVAPLKYGKSSLMHRYYEILLEHPDMIPIYVNLKRVKDPILFIVETLKQYGLDLETTYKYALRREDLLPIFERLNEMLIREKKWLFLLFDEFHLLPELVRNEGFYRNFSDELVFGFFRGVAEGARISYIVCGSVIEPLMRALDVWGGRFQTIYLGPFKDEDAVEMIKRLFNEGGMSIDNEKAKIIAEAAGYHPFYIQFMGHQIYSRGKIDRLTIRHAKIELYRFLAPIFASYLERIRKLGSEYLKALFKIINNVKLTIDELTILADLYRRGILKPENSKFEFVDPLFRRYLSAISMGIIPSEPLVVGHWAERIVGNYLLKKGYIPYYSHDSRGAFDIYVKIGNKDLGIQVRYSSKGSVYLSKDEVKRILEAAQEVNWIPILALVSKQVKFFNEIRPGKYSIADGCEQIEQSVP